MTAKQLDVAIIGAGTAGLSARAEVARVTDSYRVFDPGPYGTICASRRLHAVQGTPAIGRMISTAATLSGPWGIVGGDALKADAPRIMAETRRLRDSLVDGVKKSMESWCDTHLVAQAPVFEPGGCSCGPARTGFARVPR